MRISLTIQYKFVSRFISHDTEHFNPLNHKNQLIKDLRINILRGGLWATIEFRNMIFGEISDGCMSSSIYGFSHLR